MEKSITGFWGSESLKEKSWYYVSAGSLELWLQKHSNGELVIGRRQDAAESEQPVVPQLQWSELEPQMVDRSDQTISWDWYAGQAERETTVLPAMPDRPLVLKPQVSRHILPGCRTQLLFFIPVWLQLYDGSGEKNNLIAQYPSQILSSTWFGEMHAGELCYALEQDLLESRPAVARSPLSAVCTLNIHNDSQSLLDFQRMAVHVEYLSIFSDGHSLYTNEVFVKFNGVDQISQLKYSSRGPKWGGNFTRLKGPQVHPTKSLLKKSFYFFKSLTEM